jgi:hypothetical protein
LPTRSFLTPTADKYQHAVSKVAPLQGHEKSVEAGHLASYHRPLLEDRAQVEKSLAIGRTRTPRLPLVADAKAREVLSGTPVADALGSRPLPQWVRLLANFPKDGKSRILSLRAAEEKGDLGPLLKAEVSWIIARQDCAWYALGEAKQRLEQLRWSQDHIYRLDGDWAVFTPAERALFTLARKLAASPIVLTDEDVAQAVKLVGPREVVQLISYTTNRASFDRITEAAGLQVGQ